MNRIESNCLPINILNGDKDTLVLSFHRFGLFMRSKTDSETFDFRLNFVSQFHRSNLFLPYFRFDAQIQDNVCGQTWVVWIWPTDQKSTETNVTM